MHGTTHWRKVNTRHKLTLFQADASVRRNFAFESERFTNLMVSSFCFRTTECERTVVCTCTRGQCCQTHFWMPLAGRLGGEDQRSHEGELLYTDSNHGMGRSFCSLGRCIQGRKGNMWRSAWLEGKHASNVKLKQHQT